MYCDCFLSEPETDQLERRKSEAVATIESLKKEQEKLEKTLDEVRKKQQTDGPSANELWKEQKDLYTKIKEHRAEIRTVHATSSLCASTLEHVSERQKEASMMCLSVIPIRGDVDHCGMLSLSCLVVPSCACWQLLLSAMPKLISLSL
jgi:vacuolar-type H+-ATPase subunit I/STV1